MTTRTTIEFQRIIGTEQGSGDAITETVNAKVGFDGESFSIEIPAPGHWACDAERLRGLLAAR